MLIESPLESKRFGISAAKLVLSGQASIRDVLSSKEFEKFDFISARVPTSQIETVQTLEKRGFFLTDTLLYYKKSVAAKAVSDPYASALKNGDCRASVIAIADEAFRDYSSHYASDPRFGKEKVHEIYRDWATRSFDVPGVVSDILTYSVGSEIAGFISVIDREKTSEVQLAAVKPSFQGKGVFRGLLSALEARAQAMGSEVMLYSTQLENIQVQQTLAKEGWLISKSFYTFHFWKA